MRICGARLRFEYEVKQVETAEFVAKGFTVHCFADHSGLPKRMPAEFSFFPDGKLLAPDGCHRICGQSRC